MSYQVVPMQQDDWPKIHAIHAEGIATGLASFAENAPEWDEWDAVIYQLHVVWLVEWMVS